MPGERERLLAAFAAMQEANDQLRAELVRHKASTSQAIDEMMAQTMSPDTVSIGAAPQIRVELTEALDRFEHSRHEARLGSHLLQLFLVNAQRIHD